MITIKEEQFIVEHVGVPKFWISMEINNNWKRALQKILITIKLLRIALFWGVND